MWDVTPLDMMTAQTRPYMERIWAMIEQRLYC